MAGRVGVYNSVFWRMRDDIARVTGLTPARRFFTARGLAAAAGWGHKPAARRARAMARRHGLPYLALEDGFLRSRAPGPGERSVSYVCDPVGVYYEAGASSAFEALVEARLADPARAARDAAPVFEAIRELGLSKYNGFDAESRASFLRAAERAAPVIVVDQTAGDAAVAGAGAERETFRAMLAAAAEENPDAPILIKTHPETRLGRRPGHYDAALIAEARAASPALDAAARAGRLGVLRDPVAPRDLAAGAARFYVVSSLLGFEALIAGAAVTAFGRSFYAGWGLTDDRAPPTGRRRPAPLACLVAAAYRDYTTYLSPVDRRPWRLEDAIAHLALKG